MSVNKNITGAKQKYTKNVPFALLSDVAYYDLITTANNQNKLGRRDAIRRGCKVNRIPKTAPLV